MLREVRCGVTVIVDWVEVLLKIRTCHYKEDLENLDDFFCRCGFL